MQITSYRHGGVGGGDRDGRATSGNEADQLGGGQALRHDRVRRGASGNRSHPARHAEHDEPKIGDRRAHDVSSELPDQPEGPQADHGDPRVDEDGRYFPEDAVHRN